MMTGPHVAIVVGCLLVLGGIIGFACHRVGGDHCEKVRDYLLLQLKDGTTWRGLTLVATGLGAKVAPEHVEAIVTGGVLVAGILGVIWPPDSK
jgi:hypothetical protein